MKAIMLLAASSTIRSSAYQFPSRVLFRPFTLAATSNIEIERKFTTSCVDTLQNHLVSLGGELMGSYDIHDTYFDTASVSLTKRDTWLRLRSGVWELKVPLHSSENTGARSGGETTTFREIVGEEEVKAELTRSLLSIEDPFASSLIGALALESFAAFHTHRMKYKLGEVIIDIDEGLLSGGDSDKSWNPIVIEIECMRETADEARAAYDAIDRIAAPLITDGFIAPMSTETGGKLESYIRHFCPSHLAVLIDAGILT
uniref:CYTH domain-containing protein n=1 Tax=Octactis speculum TaxID=3111310 RepID=A0A7S2MDB5_9STRA|mmetsp:Transcript_59966/g.82077  ORF Transcript_59966/g.82077 Transcript_59966/m.82077 type:complete len:258 (+) Transcript_59966:53-826(+)|eukprot:CAMPEP_0185773678 /NCGR_PEP_ID=MMETSP1174-20130828/74644_1 /TAXON_ID=35687 /ORGANISM="Dictyocha speculum, Strain CCMP1381" /LENGTH=257 /DNA_ID=CAMNT_0028460467 /DNA_START=46 /DNA_END=819 /DNA_ORIENTATION=-